MTKVHVAVFPAVSVDVYVTVVVPTGKESPGSWVDVSICVPELSAAVGVVQVTVAVAMPDPVLTD